MNKFIKIILLVIYLAVLGFSIYGFLTLTPGDEMGVVILYMYMLLPSVTFISSIFLGREKGNNLKWLMILIFAILYYIPILIWQINAGSKLVEIITTTYGFLLVGAIVSAFGLIIGTLMKKLSDKAFKISMIIGTIIILLLPVAFIIYSRMLLYTIEKQTNTLIEESIIDSKEED